ncbi:MAG TPA: molybdopterin-dependent oxidoreductase, partial [Acidimicrobiia bacterium]|nr:molybdopterin-dependent oxidoreductase [Acidimicrobiia bacterium]
MTRPRSVGGFLESLRGAWTKIAAGPVGLLMMTNHASLSRSSAALAGTVSAGLSYGISELVAGVMGIPSLIQGVADWVVDSVPPGMKDWAISVFGTNDKLALIIGIVLVGAALGALAGMLSRHRLEPALVFFAGFGALGAFATATNPSAGTTGPWLNAILAVAGGIGAFSWLRQRPPTPEGGGPDQTRRALLRTTSVGGLALVTAGVGRLWFSASREAASQRAGVTLAAGPTGSPATASPSFAIDGLTPLVVPNEDFYRIDTAIVIPRIDLDTWSLSFSGLVDRPYQVTFAEIMEMPMVERYVTLSCVSNEVGGSLVGNARWLGVPLTDLLDRAGVQTGAQQIVGRAVDGFTVGFPVDVAYDGREAMLAVGMNGVALPLEHGYPARLVVSGLYGYVSATKWISEIELTTWDGFDAYWVPRGWAKEAPVKTQSRIDTPRGRVGIGERYIAGVAWAPNRGVSRVE